MFGIGGTELLIIALIALLVLGPDNLPEMMKKLARVIRDVRRASDEVRMHIDPDGELYRATRYPPNFNFPDSLMDKGEEAESDTVEEAGDAENVTGPHDDSEKKVD